MKKVEAQKKLKSNFVPNREQDSDEGFVSKDFDKVIWGIPRHLFLILVCAGIFSGAVFFMSKILFSNFVAESFVLYQDQGQAQGGRKIEGTSYSINRLTFPTALEMIKLPSNFKSIKSILGLRKSTKALIKMVNVEVQSQKSNLIKITVKAKSPDLALDIANTLSDVVVKNSAEINKRQFQAAYDYFQKQLQENRRGFAETLQKIALFEKEHQHFELDIGQNILVTNAVNAEEKYQEAALSYSATLVEYENLKREIGKIPDHIVSYSYQTNPLKSRIAQVQLDLLNAKTRYSKENPKVISLESSIKEMKKALEEEEEDSQSKVYAKNPLKSELNIDLMQLKSKLRSNQKIKDELAKLLEVSKQALDSLPNEIIEVAKLALRRQAGEKEIARLNGAIRSIKSMMDLSVKDLAFYQKAETVKSQKEDWKTIIMLAPLIGLLVGVFFGISLAMLIEFYDKKLCTPLQLSFSYDLPCLQVIPEIKKFKQKDTEEKILFYVQNLVDKLDIESKNKGPSSLALLSSTVGEGKSCLAYYMALYYSKRLKIKSLVLELGSTKNEFFDSRDVADYKLEDYLKGDCVLEDIIYSSNDQNPDRIITGSDRSIKELLKTEKAQNLMGMLYEKYNMVFIDVPNLIEHNYAVTGAKLAEMSMFVVGSSKSSKSIVDSALKDLEDNELYPFGIVLNFVNSHYIKDMKIVTEQKRSSKRRTVGV